MKELCSSKRLSELVRKEEDKLSSLPDSVLMRILSKLPARDAARTCLVRAFGDLWTTIDTLKFDDSPFQSRNPKEHTAELKFINFVRTFLLFHKRSKIREFSLDFSYTYQEVAREFGYLQRNTNEKPKLESEVQWWIKFALAQGVEVLDLGFGVSEDSKDGMQNFKLPHFVWTSKTLLDISLFSCEIELPRQVQMDSLMNLELQRVSLSSETLTKITSNCHSLRHLCITDCEKLDEISFSAPNIETLTVSMKDEDRNLTINCPNVRSFEFCGSVKGSKLIDLSSVKIASLCLNISPDTKLSYCQLEGFLSKIVHAEAMKLNFEFSAVLTHYAVKVLCCPCSKWKRIQLETWMNDTYILEIRNLLTYAPFLEELIIEIKYPSENLPKCIKTELDGSTYVGLNEMSSEWIIHDIREVTMGGLFKSSLTAQLDLVKHILKNASKLEKFHIFSEGNAQPSVEDALGFEELFDISKELQTLPRASKQAMVFLK